MLSLLRAEKEKHGFGCFDNVLSGLKCSEHKLAQLAMTGQSIPGMWKRALSGDKKASSCIITPYKFSHCKMCCRQPWNTFKSAFGVAHLASDRRTRDASYPLKSTSLKYSTFPSCVLNRQGR